MTKSRAVTITGDRKQWDMFRWGARPNWDCLNTQNVLKLPSNKPVKNTCLPDPHWSDCDNQMLTRKLSSQSEPIPKSHSKHSHVPKVPNNKFWRLPKHIMADHLKSACSKEKHFSGAQSCRTAIWKKGALLKNNSKLVKCKHKWWVFLFHNLNGKLTHS